MTTILREVGQIARAVQAIGNKSFDSLGLGNGQYLYLIRIYESPGVFADRLASELQVERTTNFRIIQRLVQAGYVEKRDDPVNRKIKRLFVTASGAAMYPLLHRYETETDATVLAGLTPSEQANLLKLLQKMVGAANDDWQAVKKGQRRYVPQTKPHFPEAR